jgi:hypothetical protein
MVDLLHEKVVCLYLYLSQSAAERGVVHAGRVP